MRVEIVPEPEPYERQAVLAALDAADAAPEEPSAYVSSWRRAGLAGGRPGAYWVTTPRRSSAGASRA